MNQNVRETVRDKASAVAGEAKDQARTQYEQKKSVAVGELGSLASALRRASTEVGEANPNSMSSKVISTIADRLESFGTSIEGKDLDAVFGEVQRFARRNPAAFLGGAVALGFLAARFMKSSSEALRDDDFDSDEAYGGYSGSRTDAAIGRPAGISYGSDFSAGSAGPTSSRGSGGTTTGVGSSSAVSRDIDDITGRR